MLVDMVGVTGSIPVAPTISKALEAGVCRGFHSRQKLEKGCLGERVTPRVSNGFQFGEN